VSEAIDVITGFYTRCHSMRWVGNRLIVRVNREVPDGVLAELNTEFADMLESDVIERCDTTDAEREDNDRIDLSRLALRFNRKSYARLRQFVDALNTLS